MNDQFDKCFQDVCQFIKTRYKISLEWDNQSTILVSLNSLHSIDWLYLFYNVNQFKFIYKFNHPNWLQDPILQAWSFVPCMNNWFLYLLSLTGDNQPAEHHLINIEPTSSAWPLAIKVPSSLRLESLSLVLSIESSRTSPGFIDTAL